MTERLSEMRHKRAGIIARADEIREHIKRLAKQDEDRPDEEATPQEDVDQFGALTQELEALKVALAEVDGRIQRLEAAMAADTPADDGGSGDGEEAMYTATGRSLMSGGGMRVFAQARVRPKEEVGFQIARYLIGRLHAKWNGPTVAAEFMVRRFGDVEVAKALNTQVVSEGGALIPQQFIPDLIELLRANTVFRASGPMMIDLGVGNATMPRLAGGASVGWQGELDDMALTEETFDDVNLSAKKLTGMVPVSNDLIRRSGINVEATVRDDLIAAISRKEDVTYFRSDGSGKSPIGLRSLVLPANLITIAAGGDLDAVVAGLSALKLTLVQGLSRMLRPRWVMAPAIIQFIATRRDSVGGFYYKDEIAGGTLEGIPLAMSQQIPTNLGAGNGSEIYLVDFADVVLGDTYNVTVEVSDVASYYGTDGKVVSAYQRDQSVFRVISESDLNMRHLQSLAIGLTSDWKFTGLPGSAGLPWSSQPLNPTWAQAPSAWPAVKTGANPPPTLWDPGEATTSAFDGPLTDQPGGLPPGATGAASSGATGATGPSGRGAAR